jgi:glycopeptide antibiotics resistance protein
MITAFIAVVSSSFIIEALQYILARGVTAIDDLVANIVGGVIGIFFAVILQKLKKRKSE